MVISAAYGRDYKNVAQIKADWSSGKDFVILDFQNSGRYCNNQDIPKGTFLEVRYGKNGSKVTGFKA
jgi:hypothetical protein